MFKSICFLIQTYNRSKLVDLLNICCIIGVMSVEKEVRKQLLVTIGLSDKEALLYDLLLEQGEMTGGEVERLGRQKKNTFALLKSLQRKELLTINVREGKRYYIPAPPETLELILRERRRAILTTQALFEQVLPEMSKAYKDKIGKPVVQHFSGISGLRTVFDEVYREGKTEVLSVVGNEAPDKKFYEEIINKYKPMRIKNKIFAKTISPDSPRARELKATEKLDLKEKYLVDPVKYPMPAEFDTWGDKIALMSFARGDFSAILIQHPDLAKTMRSLMSLAMDGARHKPEP